MIAAARARSDKPTRQLLNLFCLQFVYYFVATWNLRVVAQAHFVSIAISDAGLAAVNFTLIQRISKAESNMARLGYVVGGVAGSLLATFLTKLVYGA